MKNSATGKKMVIVGMGMTGLSCARYFSTKGISFRVVDSRPNPPLKDIFDKEFPIVGKFCGEFRTGMFDADDYLVVSPGVALTEPAIAAALQVGAALTSDIELFLEVIDGPVVAITGSNGKSTVTTLTAEMLKHAGMNVCMAGNIGVPVLEQALTGQKFDVYVLELSSFQLERLPRLSAKVATILNVTEDHMDRYENFAQYHAAKQRVYMGAENIVVNRDDQLNTTPLNGRMKCWDYGLSAPGANGFGLIRFDGLEWIAFGTQPLIATDSLKIKGRHNISNAMAALAIGHALGVAWQPMVEVLQSFTGLRHRCEWVADYHGVSFYNDSKATNVGAAVAAINGFSGADRKNLILIAGGLDKDSDFSPLAEVVRKNVKKVILIGKDAKKIESAIGSELCQFSTDMTSAVNDACQIGQPGDIVLLAPACASFDMFKNYEHRGDVFVSAVRGLAT